jgi:hypothetical protein
MPERLTWRDWMPPGAPEPKLLTRKELLATAERLGVRVPERTLLYWEGKRILPGPHLDHAPRRDGGPGAPFGLYPHWWVDLLFQLRRYQDEGVPLDELPPRLEAAARRLANPIDPPSSLDEPMSLYNHLAWAFWRPPTPIEPIGPPIEPPFLPDDVRRSLEWTLGNLAGFYRDIYGIEATRAEIRFLGPQGQVAALDLPLSAPEAPPSPEPNT